MPVAWNAPMPCPTSCKQSDVEALLPSYPAYEEATTREISFSDSLAQPYAVVASVKGLSTKRKQFHLGFIATALLLVFAATCAWYRAGRSGRSTTDSSIILLTAKTCAGAGENCFHSKCCKGKGMQCYHKRDEWATCKQQCVKGPDPYDIDNASWSCKALGNRTMGIPDEPLGQVADWVKKSCTPGGSSCLVTKCCSDGGKLCYEKDSTWAGCKTYCTPGPDLTDSNNGSWTCKALGFRTPGTPSEPPPTIAEWVNTLCSKSGENCIDTKCCSDEGMQCYKKTPSYGACKPRCIPGPDLQDENHRFWNCSTLGSRTPGLIPKPTTWVSPWVKTVCTGSGLNCNMSQCCADAGMQCYQKNDAWATCRPSCIPGPDIFDVNNQMWSCKTLGPRTPGTPPTLALPVAGWVSSKCAGGGEDCSKSQCCKEEGMQCYQKTEDGKGYATCKPSCLPGPDLFDVNMHVWNCKTLGQRTPGKPFEPLRKIADWVKTNCSGPGQDCSHTQCCKGDGMQCYQKKEGWATCKSTCVFNEIDPYDNQPWSCNTLGPRTPGLAPCVANDEDCRFSTCCNGAGRQCFEKNEHWAGCKEVCDTAEPDGQWSCKPLGNRTKFGTPLGCTWAGEDCGLSKTCCQEGLKCYTQDENYAGCLPGPRPGWTNDVIGGSRMTSGKGNELSWGSNIIMPAAVGKQAGTSLFCFMAVMKYTVEEKLMYAQKAQGASVYGCDRNYIFPAKKVEFKHEGSWNSVANTAVFLNIWRAILKRDDWLRCDWTVKVDPDTVFFPDRLRQHLWALKPPAYTAIYLKNTLMFNGFLGAIEIFSRDAVKLYHDYGEGCAKDMAENGGEDGFFKLCMDSIGVGYMLDDDILSSKGYPKLCNGTFVAYHPFKEVDSWIACRDIAAGKMEWGPALDEKFGTD